MANWTKTFMDLARFYASLSKDPSTKCGAVIAKGKRQISQGFNGLPQGVIDSPERLNNRQIKYPMVIHAEVNAILFAAQPLHGCSIYVWPMAPCARCAGLIIQSGIKTVFAPKATPEQLERWGSEMEMANRMYYESGVMFCNVSLTGELNMDWSSEVSFRKNLDQFFANNEVSENVQNLIWKSLEEKANAR